MEGGRKFYSAWNDWLVPLSVGRITSPVRTVVVGGSQWCGPSLFVHSVRSLAAVTPYTRSLRPPANWLNGGRHEACERKGIGWYTDVDRAPDWSPWVRWSSSLPTPSLSRVINCGGKLLVRVKKYRWESVIGLERWEYRRFISST